MNTCQCGSNTQSVDFEIHVRVETKKYKSSQCLGNCLLPYTPCSLPEVWLPPFKSPGERADRQAEPALRR